jgi:DNA-binding SARP family transcriptional activator
VLKLHTLGAVYVVRDGQHLAGAAGQRRLLALLATLAASGEGGVSRDKLLELLWPEARGDRARHALTQALYNARRVGDENPFFSGSDINLNAHRISSDVGEFLKAIDRGDDVTAFKEYQGPLQLRLDCAMAHNALSLGKTRSNRRRQPGTLEPAAPSDTNEVGQA